NGSITSYSWGFGGGETGSGGSVTHTHPHPRHHLVPLPAVDSKGPNPPRPKKPPRGFHSEGGSPLVRGDGGRPPAVEGGGGPGGAAGGEGRGASGDRGVPGRLRRGEGHLEERRPVLLRLPDALRGRLGDRADQHRRPAAQRQGGSHAPRGPDPRRAGRLH